jgi:bacillithiol biosynthesis cysteine-adding enzyme BshC
MGTAEAVAAGAPGAPEVFVRTVPLGGSALSRALQAGHPWIPARPTDAASWARHAASVRAGAPPGWLDALAPACAATGAAAERLARAAASGVVVTTGQQPGLFGGPLYTISKALTALALADALEAATGLPVAPVFWAATDDSDWQEAAVAHVVGKGGLDVLRLEGPPTEGMAMADVPLGPTGALLARLRLAAGSVAHPAWLALTERAYVAHATIGGAYVQFLRALLEPLGIAVLDAAHPALRAAADPLLRRALLQAGSVAAALSARTAAITAAGFEPQVDGRDDLTLVFRTRLRADGRTRARERVPLAAAAAAAREAEPGTLGANVLLRPVLERAVLPTVGYCAGPGEFAYFAQVTAVAEALGEAPPMPLPRWSGYPVPADALRLLDRLGVDEASLGAGEALATRLARGALDDQVADALERLQVAIDAQARALGDAVAQADALVPAAVVEGLRRDLQARLARAERRLLAAVKRRESGLLRDLAVARAWLRPLGGSPERVLSVVPLLARYGSQVLDAMRAAARTHAQALVTGGAERA